MDALLSNRRIKSFAALNPHNVFCTMKMKLHDLSRRVATGRSPAEIVDRIPPGAWIFACCECRVLSGRGLCDELITRPEESYRLSCVVCDLETSRIGAPYIYIYIYI